MTSATNRTANPATAATSRAPVSETAMFSDLLLSLYAATFDDAQWPVFLDRLCEATGSLSGFFMRNDATLGNQILASGGIPVAPASSRHYRESGGYTDPVREAYMRRPRIGVVEGEDILPHAELMQTEMYLPIIRTRGWEHMTCVIISLTPRSQQLLSLWRGAGRMYLEPDRRELLELLLPHLQNAIRIRQTLGEAETRAHNAEAALDASASGSILLDARGRILHINRAAQQMALAEDAFRVDINRIVPVASGVRAKFDQLVATAAAAYQEPGGALSLPRRDGKPPLNLLVTPLRLPQQHRGTVRVLLLLTDPTDAVVFPDTVLRSLYALTPAETEIANGLLTGLSLAEIARLRKVSLATVRTQMNSLLAKTNTERQAELVSLLANLPRRCPA